MTKIKNRLPIIDDTQAMLKKDKPAVVDHKLLINKTFDELYPDIDLNKTVYDNKRSFLGESDKQFYLINKLDGAVIVFDKEPKSTFMVVFVFMHNILVNAIKCRHLFISTFTSFEPSEIQRERYEMYVEFLEPFYTNDTRIHLSENIASQINHFMKSVEFFDVKLHFMQEHGKKILSYIHIQDKVYNFLYKAIIRDELVYFTMMFNEDPERETFVKSKFELNEYRHYEAGDSVIDTFVGDWFTVESHYDPELKSYTIKTKQLNRTKRDMTDSIDILKEHEAYDVNFIFNYIYDSVVINHPRYSFVEKLTEMSILQEDEQINHEHMKLYEMATI